MSNQDRPSPQAIGTAATKASSGRATPTVRMPIAQRGGGCSSIGLAEAADADLGHQ